MTNRAEVDTKRVVYTRGGFPVDRGQIVRWSRRLVARVTHYPTALGYPYIHGGESERTFRDSRRGLSRSVQWVDNMLDQGPRP